MAQDFRKASEQFINSGFFRRAVKSGDFTEVLHQLNNYIICYHNAVCIAAAKAYGNNRLSTDQIIKPVLRNLDFAKVEFYPKLATDHDKLGR